jgi:hypothetical protein
MAIVANTGSNVKRKPRILQQAADEEAYLEAADRTIPRTVARETLEETGLVVTRIAKEFPGFEYSTQCRGSALAAA